MDFAIEHSNDTAGIGCKVWVVRHHNDRVAAFMDIGQFFHNNMTSFTVEVAGWLVC
ncbi:hypothetical protein D9M68_958900 [compost metagenome]